jgi:hypothetical protein
MLAGGRLALLHGENRPDPVSLVRSEPTALSSACSDRLGLCLNDCPGLPLPLLLSRGFVVLNLAGSVLFCSVRRAVMKFDCAEHD